MSQDSSDSPIEDETEDNSPEWWEMLDWNEMKKAWITLPEETKELIREAGLAPDDERET